MFPIIRSLKFNHQQPAIEIGEPILELFAFLLCTMCKSIKISFYWGLPASAIEIIDMNRDRTVYISADIRQWTICLDTSATNFII
jgi:hypothetical protein